jgi:hypothetical protein
VVLGVRAGQDFFDNAEADTHWPRELYSFEFPDKGHMPVGTWSLLEGEVKLQPNFDNLAETPWPDGSRRVRIDGDLELDDAAGDDVPMRRPKPKIWTELCDEDYEFWVIRIGYWRSCLLNLGYIPRTGRGKRPPGEADFVAAWLHEHSEGGCPRPLLQAIIWRSQQSVSRLLARHRVNHVEPELEPWGSRRRARPRPKLFYPNRSTDIGPYWASSYVPHWAFGGDEVWNVEGGRSKESEALQMPRIADAAGVGSPSPTSRASYLGDDDMTQQTAEQLLVEAKRTNELLGSIEARLPVPAEEEARPPATVIELDSRRPRVAL